MFILEQDERWKNLFASVLFNKLNLGIRQTHSTVCGIQLPTKNFGLHRDFSETSKSMKMFRRFFAYIAVMKNRKNPSQIILLCHSYTKWESLTTFRSISDELSYRQLEWRLLADILKIRLIIQCNVTQQTWPFLWACCQSACWSLGESTKHGPGSMDPFLEWPGNLTGPKLYRCVLTSNEVHFVSLADNFTVQFFNLLKLLSGIW